MKLCERNTVAGCLVIAWLFGVFWVNCGPIDAGQQTTPPKHKHNRVAVADCDDTINGIGIDWNGPDNHINETHYMCWEEFNPDNRLNMMEEPFAREMCKTPPLGYHVCLNEEIKYPERVPTGGPHRPVWVTYGEYLYMPPQRWIHAIEHGAAAFLYNPCADPKEIDYFKMLAKSCLRKHIITPYKHLPEGEWFNVVTFGCKLGLNKIFGNEKPIISYLKRHAIKDGPEFHIVEDGEYKFGLLEQAQVVSDLKDSKICLNINN